MENQKQTSHKPLLVKILQWFYLVLGLVLLAGAFFYQNLNFIPTLGIGNEFILGFFGLVIGYCLVLSVSFFIQNTNLLILALVLIFFTTIGSLIVLIASAPNASEIISGNLPECSKSLATCTSSEGIVVASAAALSVALPTLILNVITIVGAIKGIAASD